MSVNVADIGDHKAIVAQGEKRGESGVAIVRAQPKLRIYLQIEEDEWRTRRPRPARPNWPRKMRE